MSPQIIFLLGFSLFLLKSGEIAGQPTTTKKWWHPSDDQAFHADDKYFKDKHAYLYVHRRLMFMTRVIHMDVEQKLLHITKYTALHEGDISFELALIMAGINIRFTDALKIYRHMSDVRRIQKAKMYSNVTNAMLGFDWAEQVLICVSMYGSILIFNREFHNTVDNYKLKLERIREEKRKCKRAGTCRRAFDVPVRRQSATETEFDYFGHVVPKMREDKHKDFFDRLMNLTTDTEFNTDFKKSYDFFEQDHTHTKNFTKINDWLRYIVKTKDEEGTETLDDEEVDKILPKNWKPLDFTDFTTKFLDRPIWDEIGKLKDRPRFTSDKPRKNLFGEKGMDYDFKRKLREKYFKSMQGDFDPEREGIHIDLTYV